MQTALWGVLGILKILGIVLLGILAFLLVLLLLVLLVPLRYRIQGSYDKEPEGQAGVSWLCHFLSVKAVYKEKLTVAVRVLGIRVFCIEKTFGKESKGTGDREPEMSDILKAEENPENIKVQREDFESPDKISEKSESEGPAVGNSAKGDPPEQAGEKRKGHRSGRGKARKGKNRKKQGFSFSRLYDKLKKKLRESLEKLRGSVKKLQEGLAALLKKKEELRVLIRDEANRRTCRLLKRQIWAILRHIFPTKITGWVRFGFEDPFTTGQVLTYISPFYGLYARDFQVIPVFEESVMEGQGKIKGRIRIGTLIMLVVRVFFDKNFRGWLRKLRKS